MIEMYRRDLKAIFDFCRNNIRKDGDREALKFINLKFKGSSCVATSCDGYRIHQLTVQAESDIEELNIPIIKIPPFKKNEKVQIDCTDKDVTFDFADIKMTVKRCVAEYIEVDKIIPQTEVKGTVYVNAQFLMEACKSLNSGVRSYVKIELRENPQPLMVYGENDNFALVLPCRCGGESK